MKEEKIGQINDRCIKILIPCSVFTPHPSLVVRHANSCPLFVPFVKTQYHHSSFFISIIPSWNHLPEAIVSLGIDLAFHVL